jgi:hypothetical protein
MLRKSNGATKQSTRDLVGGVFKAIRDIVVGDG